MPQKVPWPDNYFVAFPARSAEGDVLLKFAKYAKESKLEHAPIVDAFGRSDSRKSEWWSQYPAVLNLLTENSGEQNRGIRMLPFWNKTFVPCGEFFKTIKKLERTNVVVFQTWCEWARIRHSEEEVPNLQRAVDEEVPFLFCHQDVRNWENNGLYLFGPFLWKVTQEERAAESDHFRLLFLQAIDKDRIRFERLKNRFSGLAGAKLDLSREAIPERVRIFVWRRDGGKCVRCGSNERLEFDHIIPVSEGGSNTERNIQLLCEPCNRSKSATI